MADTKISGLTAASALAGSEVVPGVQSAANVKITFTQVATYVTSTLAAVAASGAYADLSGKPSVVLTTNNGSDFANIGTTRTNLGLAIGTNVQAWSANLDSYATVAPSANVLTFLGAANYAAMKVQLSLTIGTNVQAWSAQLDAVAALATNGLVARTAANTVAARTLTAPAAGITVSNGDGVAGNPTLALADDLSALEALSGTDTIYRRSGTSTWGAVTYSGAVSFSGGVLTNTGPPKFFSSTSSPGVNDDNTAGYAVGSTGINTNTKQIYVCTDATTGAAKWDLDGYALQPGYVAGLWYAPIPIGTTAGALTVASTAYFIPVIFSERMTIDQLGARVTTLSASGNFQLAIYANDATTNNPTGNKLASTGNMSTGTATMVTAALGANYQVEPGKLYWLAMMVDNTVAVFAAMNSANAPAVYIIGSSTAANVCGTGAMALGRKATYTTFGTWPDMTSASWSDITTNVHAFIVYHVTSTP